MLSYSPRQDEAMVLGSPGPSPINSPPNFAAAMLHSQNPLGLNRQVSQNSPAQKSDLFAPSFLLGGQTSSSYRDSPVKPRETHNIGGNRGVTWSPELVQRIPDPDTKIGRNRNLLNQSGPPLKALISETNNIPERRLAGLEDASTSYYDQGNLGESIYNSSQQGRQNKTEVIQTSHMSPSQADPFYTQGDDFDPKRDMDPCWVTVFGFPPDSASYVFQRFAEYGTILHHVISERGNWMHLHYQSPLQAQKALSKNTKKLTENIMVGVTPCIEKDAISKVRKEEVTYNGIHSPLKDTSNSLMNTPSCLPLRRLEGSELGRGSDLAPTVSKNLPSWQTSTPAEVFGTPVSQQQQHPASTSFQSPNPKGVGNMSTAVQSPHGKGQEEMLNCSGFGTPKGGMRSLTAAYQAANQPYQVVKGVSTPTKQDAGMLNKAWSYVFG